MQEIIYNARSWTDCRMKVLLLLLIIPSSFCFASDCTQSDARCKQLDKLVTVLRYNDIAGRLAAVCNEDDYIATPDQMMAKDPKTFGKVEKGSPKWQKMNRAHEEYIASTCKQFASALVANYRDAWGRRLNDEELKILLKFLETPAGKAYAQGVTPIYLEVSQGVLPTMTSVGVKAYQRYEQKLKDIANE